MGSSKVALTGLVTMIIGIYSMGIKKAETAAMTASNNRAYTIQVEELAKTALHVAMNDLSSLKKNDAKGSHNKSILGGTIDYTIVFTKGDDSEARVTVVTTINGTTSTLVAMHEKVADSDFKGNKLETRGRWKTVKTYSVPSTVNL